jgi:hypothetical protein
LNDLWSYDYTNSEWTWLYGDQEIDVPSDMSNNIPGGRNSGSGWIDPIDRSLFLFGGRLTSSSIGGDLWRWKDNSWSYLGGTINQISTGSID